MAETPEEKSARVKKQWADKKAQKQHIQKDTVSEKDYEKIVKKFETDMKYELDYDAMIEDNIIAKDDPMTDVIDTLNKVQAVNKEPQTINYMSEVLELTEAPKIRQVRSKVSIRPYVPVDEIRAEKMGLDEQKVALFPGTYQVDRIGMHMRNNLKVYITGLNENAPSVQGLTGDARNGKIKSIREVVAFLENTLANNYTVSRETCMVNHNSNDPEKPDRFWKNVTMFNSATPDKFDAKGIRIETYWDKVELKLDNDGKELDLSDPHDLVIFHAIEAGGLSLVAPSLSVAMEKGVYNFYLDQPEETAGIRSEHKKLKADALGYLTTMLNNDKNKLFLMTKLTAPVNSAQYHRGGPTYTPDDQLFDDTYDYLDGKLGDDSKSAVGRFLEFYHMSPEEIIRRAVIKDATSMHLIEPKGDGQLYYIKRNARMGKTIEDIVEFLRSKLNIDIWDELRTTVEKQWAS